MLFFIATLLCAVAAKESLSPPYFDIGKGKNIYATATCGEDFTPPRGAPGELYCTLAELHGKFAFKGFSCSYCVPGDYGNGTDGEDGKDHNIRNAIDGSNRWWQSPPLSRGLKYREVNITIDLGQSFHVAYVIIKSANSPRPGVWALERSNDNGKTYLPWHYFAPSSAECRQYFGVDSYLPIVRDDSVICSTEYSQIPPFRDGEIHLSLINGRPGALNFSHSETLQTWTMATNIRLRFLDIKTLLTDLLPLSLEDPSVTRRYYYSIKDISIGGRCMCNGFADDCQPSDIVGRYQCKCQYNTAGERCSQCKPGYVQHKWQPRTTGNDFQCEKCNCHGHTEECVYDEQVEQKKLSLNINGKHSGGGVCKNCLHNTHGINCEKCKPFFYKPRGRRITDEDVCQPCNCDTNFSTGLCAEETGQCECKKNYAGRYCNRCNKGYHSFPSCIPCECNNNGSLEGECRKDQDVNCRCKPGFDGETCDRCKPGFYGFPNCTACSCLTRFGALDNNCKKGTGQCRCKDGYSGRACEKCGSGFWQFPYCKDCSCDPRTTKDEICEPGTGTCICKPNFHGDRCNECAPGFYGHPSCYACDCSEAGSESSVCDVITGKCTCKPNYEGYKCNRCAQGFYGYPTCIPCTCNDLGSRSSNCDSQTGQCSCRPIYSSRRCDKCLPGFYGFPDCQRCNCNPAGTVTVGGRPGDCSTNNNGQCVCKANVRGLECNECKSGYYNLRESNPDGCSDCECYRAGTNNGILSCKSNQCECKANVVKSRCRECADGFFNLTESNQFGCEACSCDVGGSKDSTCNKKSGECSCFPNIIGRRCDRVKDEYYFPSLHHIKVEMEEGTTPDGDAVRFDYQETKFPGYTWIGFVSINNKQPIVIATVKVPDGCSGSGPSFYQLMFKYVMNQIQSEIGKVSVYQVNGDRPQEGIVNFLSTQREDGFTSAYEKVYQKNGRPLLFKLTPGKWNIKIEVPDSRLLLDHAVLLPQEYVDAVYLSKYVKNPCEVNTQESFCNLYQFISLNKPGIDIVEAEIPGKYRGAKHVPLFNDTKVLSKLDFQTMVLISPEYNTQDILFSLEKAGKYVAVIQFYHDSDEVKPLDFYIRNREVIMRGKALLRTCRYTFGCRQTVLQTDYRDVKIFNIKGRETHMISLVSKTDAVVAVDSVVFIPYEQWNLDYATPKLYCVTKDGKCTVTDYHFPRGAIVHKPKYDLGEKRPSYLIDPNVKVKYLKSGTNILDVTGVSGKYHIVLHYYQPNHPSFEFTSGVYTGTGAGLPTNLKLDFCPYLSGCREALKRSFGESTYVLESGKSRLRFDVPEGKDFWIEYVLFIPEGLLSEEVFKTKPVKLSNDFIKQCAGKDFNVIKNVTAFCRDSVFSLTTKCNQGAVKCECSPIGSYNSSCEKFGGQCPCRENVIGRTCTRCKIGYYGYPNCKKCKCSSCEDLTGRCTCPPGVTGEKCDRCKPGTFGYDSVIGCQACKCDRVGTGSVNAVCDVVTGQCPCLKSFGSRKCSVCAPGFYDYPRCLKCNCFAPGVTDKKCDGSTGRCFCQENTVGLSCSECVTGYFKTKALNPKKLCTKCWCKGRGTSCQEAILYRTRITSPSGAWTMSQGEIKFTNNDIDSFSAKTLPFSFSPQFYEADLNDHNPKIKSANPIIIYWVAPKEFLGNKVSSYGGKLTYDFVYSVKKGFKSQPLEELPDIIIKSGKITLRSGKQISRIPGKVHNMSITLSEGEWLNNDGTPATREQVLTVLSNIERIHIRATHDEHTGISTLSNVVMDGAAKKGVERVFGIEQCNCQAGYTGLSCAMCASGYTRQKDGTCGKCQCSGRSTTCDPETGNCTQCTGNTEGDHCEKCKRGFYGDKCKPCECPSADPNNNFADSCNIAITTGSLVCNCKPGYAGSRCEKCADGYFGDRKKNFGSCKKCLCNGNIDTQLTGNCNQTTGECYKCVNNTAGFQCDVCRPGYYGDAIKKKNCRDCKCDMCGSSVKPCDNKSGQCQCKKNVEGTRCNRCKPNTWNFHACGGCQDCGCGPASISEQCDKNTGKCKCKPSVTGKRCDWCALGFYEYSANGCKPCDCPNGGYCDVKTGNCDCGDKGKNCTLCQEGHIIENGKCVECDSCVQNTLKRVNILITNITTIKTVLFPVGSISLSSLDEVNKTLIRFTNDANKFGKKLKELQKSVRGDEDSDADCKLSSASLLNGNDTAKCSVSKVLQDTDERYKKVSKKVSKLEKDAYDSSRDAKTTKKRAEDMLKKTQDFLSSLDELMNIANSSLGGLNGGTTDDDTSLKKALEILKELRERNFTAVMKSSDKEKESATNKSITATELMKKAMDVHDRVKKFNNTFKDLLDAFRHLKNSSSISKAVADNAADIVNMAKDIDYQSLIDLAKDIDAKGKLTLEDAKKLLEGAENARKSAKESFENFNSKRKPLAKLMDELRKFIEDLKNGYDMAKPEVDKSIDHAKNLKKLADELKSQLQDTKKFAESALKAANAYKTIVDAIYEALDAAKMANETAHEANRKAGAAKAVATASKDKSGEVTDEAKKIDEEDKKNLKISLDGLRLRVDELKRLRELIQGRVDVVKEDINEFDKEKDVGSAAKNLSAAAERHSAVAKEGKEYSNKIKDLVKEDNKIVDDLRDNIGDINKKIKEAAAKVKKVEDEIPLLEKNIDLVNQTHTRIQETIDNNITNSIKYIKFLIANSRNIADDVELAMQFNKTSSLLLDPPKAAYDPSASNRMSLVFQNGAGGDAMLLFMGNGNDPESGGYLGFDIVNKKVRFHYKPNVGDGQFLEFPSGPAIASDKWYKIEATRNLKLFSLRVVEISTDGAEIGEKSFARNNTYELPILTLGRNSDVLLGSFPAGKKKPALFNAAPFEGCMEQLTYDDEVMGLWDWKEAKHVGGCKRKNRVPDSGDYCFTGDGFVDFDLTTLKFKKVDIQKFTTLEKDGLIILAMDPPSDSVATAAFFALEIEDGYLVSKFDFGGGYRMAIHKEFGKVNDGKEHKFLMRYSRRNIRFEVDDFDRVELKHMPNENRFEAKVLYIGGIPMNEYYPEQVSGDVGFSGCIGGIVLKLTTYPLNAVKNALNYQRGFRNPTGRTASFPSEKSYLDVTACNMESRDIVSFAFSFQTYKESGTLVFAKGLIITLVDGVIEVTLILNDGEKTVFTNNMPSLADGKWHTVSLVNQYGKKIILGTDNYTVVFESDKLKDVLNMAGNMNIGGGPGLSGFNGNIREVLCSAQVVNLAASSLYEGATVGSLKFVPPLELTIPADPMTGFTLLPTTTQKPATEKPTTEKPTTQKPTTEKPTTEKPTTQKPTTEKATTEKPTPEKPTTEKPTTEKPTTEKPTTEKPTTEKPTTGAPTTEKPTSALPVIVEQPTTTQSPPDITDSPTTTLPPVTTQLPITTQPVVTSQQATTTLTPVTTQPPETTLPPVTTQLPETTLPLFTDVITKSPNATQLPPVSKMDTPEPTKPTQPDGHYGFGLYPDSYIGFDTKQGSLLTKSDYEFYFYSLAENGILLSLELKSKYDYEAIALSGGKLMYTFNAGSGSLVLLTNEKFNDGKWHKVETSRVKQDGSITVDGILQKSGSSKGSASSVNVLKKVYFGGVPNGKLIPPNIPKASQVSMKGAIKDIKVGGKAMEFTAVEAGVSLAYVNGLSYTNGAYFGEDGGYVEKESGISIGVNFKLSIDIRAYKTSGYLFYAAGRSDGINLILLPNGNVKSECDNGGGLFSVEVEPSETILDGEFHTILLEKKGQTLTLNVDGKSNSFTTTITGISADTAKQPFYFGGLPVNKRPKDYQVFSGCIAGIKVKDKTINLSTKSKFGGSVHPGCRQ